MIWCLNLCFFEGRTLIVNWYVVTIGIVVTIGNSRNNAKLLAVLFGKLTAQAFCWRSQDGVVVVVLIAELVSSVTHISNNLQA